MNLKAAVVLDVFLAVLPAVRTFVTEASQECTLPEFQNCLQSLESNSNDLSLVSTKPELEAICRDLEVSMQCVDTHMKLCFSPTQRKVFNQVVAGSKQVLSELCVPGLIQEAYLRHATCYINITSSEGKCALKYKRLIDLSQEVDKKKNVDEGLRETCCAFNEFVLCKQYYVLQDCGRDAAEFLQTNMERISGHLLHEHCAHYTYGRGRCSNINASKTISSIAWSYLLFSSILLSWTNMLLLTDVT